MSVEELRRAFEKYIHLLKGGRVDIRKSLEIESMEEKIIKDIFSNKIDINLNKDLNNILDELFNNGALLDLIKQVGEEMNAHVSSPRKAYENFLVGNLDDAGARVAFIVVQAIARAKAIVEESKGVVEEITPFCPLCGAESRTMVKREDGYFMVCSFCGYTWRISRVFTCPYCGNRDKMSLGVFTDKRTRRIGLAWCQECGSSWRIILDEKLSRSLPRLFIPVIAHAAEVYRVVLEDVTSNAAEDFEESYLEDVEGGAEGGDKRE